MNTDCRTIQPKLSEFLDDQLDARTAWEVQTHVAGCAACAQTQRQLSTLRDALRTLPAPALSTGFDAALEQRLALTRRPAAPAPMSVVSFCKDRLRNWRNDGLPDPLWRPSAWRPALALGAVVAAASGLFFLPAAAPPLPPPAAVSTAAADHAFVAECLAQRRREAAGEPLADLAAQNLAGHLDAAPAASEETPAADAGMF